MKEGIQRIYALKSILKNYNVRKELFVKKNVQDQQSVSGTFEDAVKLKKRLGNQDQNLFYLIQKFRLIER